MNALQGQRHCRKYQMLYSDTGLLKILCDLIAMKHITKQLCTEYLDDMQQHILSFLVTTTEIA